MVCPAHGLATASACPVLISFAMPTALGGVRLPGHLYVFWESARCAVVEQRVVWKREVGWFGAEGAHWAGDDGVLADDGRHAAARPRLVAEAVDELV